MEGASPTALVAICSGSAVGATQFKSPPLIPQEGEILSPLRKVERWGGKRLSPYWGEVEGG